MHKADQLVVKVVGRAFRDAPDKTGDNQVGDLADEKESSRNNGSLQVDVRPNQLGELLYLGDQFSQ